MLITTFAAILTSDNNAVMVITTPEVLLGACKGDGAGMAWESAGRADCTGNGGGLSNASPNGIGVGCGVAAGSGSVKYPRGDGYGAAFGEHASCTGGVGHGAGRGAGVGYGVGYSYTNYDGASDGFLAVLADE